MAGKLAFDRKPSSPSPNRTKQWNILGYKWRGMQPPLSQHAYRMKRQLYGPENYKSRPISTYGPRIPLVQALYKVVRQPAYFVLDEEGRE
ncbi:MAG: hypothetical protein Q9217_002181 [Psora testacea]